MEEAQYSAADWVALQEALAEGERVLGDPEAIDEDIADAARALRIALEQETESEEETETDE